MKEKEKIERLLYTVALAKEELEDELNPKRCQKLVFSLIVDYIEFMLTPCEDDE